MAMTTTNNEVKKEEVKTNEQTAVVAQQAENQPAQQVQQPEKEKKDWKAIGKKVAIGLGATAVAAGTFIAGFVTGSHSKNSGSNQDVNPSGDSQSSEGSAF